MPRVVHFEIHADQPERAAKFYNDVFGWQISQWEGSEGYWLIKTGEAGEPGINGGLMKRGCPSASTINSIDVPSVDDFVTKITQNGGTVVIPKMPIPGVGYLAYCQDTEGNTFGVFQTDESAS
ncbi:VOC family protein [Candidatus Poribacteria bacterium]|nr:VOC family protein [Candidatus Poribacteria bacterium]